MVMVYLGSTDDSRYTGYREITDRDVLDLQCMSKKSQTVMSSQTDNVSAPFKCDIMVVKRLLTVIWHVYWRDK